MSRVMAISKSRPVGRVWPQITISPHLSVFENKSGLGGNENGFRQGFQIGQKNTGADIFYRIERN